MEGVKDYVAQLNPSFAGKFFYYCLPYRKKVILKNMQQVFSGALSEKEMIKLAKCFYSHVAMSLRENFLMSFMSQEKQCDKVEVVGYDIALKLALQMKGALILTGHFGNWEFAPVAGMLNFKELTGKFHFVRKTFNNKTLEKILFNRFKKAGLNVIPKKNSLDKVCDAIDAKEAVIFIMDQHASIKAKDGIMVEFFGKKAGTFRSLAMLANHTGAPLLPACTYRKPDGNHVLHYYEPLEWQSGESAKDEIYKNTLAYNKALEKMILAHPEQWMWTHKRWKPSDK